jgi:hypothetical protein
MTEKLFPIGKHKGHPIEMVLETDPQYAAWIVQQSWFAEGHPDIYQIIINNGQEPSETPDHNALQARFLDPVFNRKFAETLLDRNMSDKFEGFPELEVDGADVYLRVHYPITWSQRDRPDRPEETGGSGEAWLVEVKPSLGDDYPAILRTMKRLRQPKARAKHLVLIYRDFAARGATLEQVTQAFNLSNIAVVSFESVESRELAGAETPLHHTYL